MSKVLRWSSRPARGESARVVDVDERLAQLVAVRRDVQESLQQSRELDHGLRARLDHLRGRLSPVISEALPREEAWTGHLDHATQCVMSVQGDDLRVVRKVIALGEPAQDLHGYLAAVMQLEEALRCHRRELEAASRWVQEAVRCLESASVQSDRLRGVLRDLKAEQAGGIGDGGLMDVALGKLEMEFKRLLREHCVPVALPTKMGPQTEDAPFSSFELEYLFGFSPEALEQMQVIMSRMVGSAHYQRCVEAYDESRIEQCRRSLDLEYLPEMVDKLPWTELQSMIQRWTQQVEVAVKVLYAGERRLAREVFKECGQPMWVERLGAISLPGMSAFLQFGESVSRSSRSPEKLCKLLEMLEGLKNSEHTVIQVFDGQACCGIRSRYRELLKQVSSGACNAFYDMSAWVEEQKEPHPLDGGIMKLCSFVVNYMNYLVQEYLPPLQKALRSQRSPERTFAEGILLPLQALERKLEARAEEILDRPLRHLFLMNNFQYVYMRVDSSDVKEFLDHSWIFGVGRKVDKHTLKYRSNFCRKLLIHLNQEALANSSKAEARLVARQSVKAFAAALDDALRSPPVICHDTLREATRGYVTEHVASAYRRYLDSFGHLLEGTFSSSTAKYVKYSPETVQQALSGLFSLRRQHSANGS